MNIWSVRFGVFLGVGCITGWATFAAPPISIYQPNSGENLDRFGFSVAALGDLNGDGADDFAVGAPYARRDIGGLNNQVGAVYVFSGVGEALLYTLETPNRNVLGRFGESIARVPDLNNDGVDDIVVGAPGEAASGSPNFSGRAYVFSGATGVLLHELDTPNATLQGGFGASVAGLEDVNADARGDILVGASLEEPAGGGSKSGRAYVFSGANGALIRTFTSPNQEDSGEFGRAVCAIGDLTGDGINDIVVGAPGEDALASSAKNGRVYLFNGVTGAFIQAIDTLGSGANMEFGARVLGVADMNSDGTPDLLISAPRQNLGDDFRAGQVHLISGSDGSHIRSFSAPAPEIDGAFGSALAELPDVSGDGVPDFAAGATGDGLSGKVYIFPSNAAVPQLSLEGPGVLANALVGASLAFLPGATAAGPPSLLIGAPEDFGENDQTMGGRVFRWNDFRRPTVSINAPFDSTSQSPFFITVSFDETVSLLQTANLTVVNGAATNVAGDSTNQIFVVSIVPTVEGPVAISIPENTVFDESSNGNRPSNVLTVDYDLTPPAISIGAPSETSATGVDIEVPITFDGAAQVTLHPDDVLMRRVGTASADIEISGSGLEERTVLLRNLRGTGALTIALRKGVALDAAGNESMATDESAVITVLLGGSQEVLLCDFVLSPEAPLPPAGNGATGSGSLYLLRALPQNQFRIAITHTVENPVEGGLYQGASDENGILQWSVASFTSPIDSTLSLGAGGSNNLLTLLMQGLLYIQIEEASGPALRGQLNDCSEIITGEGEGEGDTAPFECSINLLADGGFESTGAWELDSGTGVSGLCTDAICTDGGAPSGGSGWLRFRDTDAIEDARATQSFSLVRGGTAFLRFHLRTSARGNSVLGFIRVEIDGATVFTADADDVFYQDAYQEVLVEVPDLAAGDHNVSIVANFSVSTIGETVMNVDEVCLGFEAAPCASGMIHSADQDSSGNFNLSELLRVIQFFNSGGYGCQLGSEDGYAPNSENRDCCPHDSDYNSQDWQISLSELLRLIQLFNSGGYFPCESGEDGFCPGTA